jgi:hypothetical protein
MSTEDRSLEEQHRQHQVMDIAYTAGLKIGVPSFVASASGVYYFFKTKPGFAKKFGFSAMSGFPLMCGIFGFVVMAEKTMFDAHRNPENYGLVPLKFQDEAAPKKNWYISPYKVILNQYIDSPASMLVAISTPLAATIAYQQSQLTHLGISQRVLHSRVLAQGGVLSILVVTMLLQKYMVKRGRFYPDEVE